jgi:hypothetical protein
MTAAEVSGALEEYASVAKQAVDVARQAVDAARLWRRRYLTLKRRSRLVLDKVRDAVAQLEAADGNDPHVQAALELLYDLEHSLEVGGK